MAEKLSFFLIVVFTFLRSLCLADPLFEKYIDCKTVELADTEIQNYMREGIWEELARCEDKLLASEKEGDYRAMFEIHGTRFYYYGKLYHEYKNVLYIDLAQRELQQMEQIISEHGACLGDHRAVALISHELSAYGAMLREDHEKVKEESQIMVNFYSSSRIFLSNLVYWQILLGKAMYKSGDRAEGEALILSAIQSSAAIPYQTEAHRLDASHIYLALSSLCLDDNRIKDAIDYIQKHREAENRQDSDDADREALKLVCQILQKTGCKSINDYLSNIR